MPPTNLFGLGYGVGPAGYGYPSVGSWSPLSLGSSLAAWYRADAGCYTDAACRFASASSQYLSKTSPTFAPTTKMTIRCSWKPTSVGALQAIACRWTPGNTSNQFILAMQANGKMSLYVADAVSDPSNNVCIGSTVLVAGSQYEIAVVYDGTQAAGSRVAMYVNGVAETITEVGTIPATLTTSTAILDVGVLYDAIWHANGALARLGFSSLALSGAALTAAHTSTFWADMTAARQADWFSFYNLCEASSTRVDSTGLNNLTPTNGPTVAAGPGEGLAVNNSPVKRWEDQSGNADHATQSTIAAQPLWIASGKNGRPTVRFDGVNDAMSTASSVARVFACFATILQADNATVFGIAGGNNRYFFLRSGLLYVNDGAANANGAYATGSWGVLSGRMDASGYLRANGVELGTGAMTTRSGASFLGRRENAGDELYLSGDIAEGFVATSAPTAAGLSSSESYLNTRYAAY